MKFIAAIVLFFAMITGSSAALAQGGPHTRADVKIHAGSANKIAHMGLNQFGLQVLSGTNRKMHLSPCEGGPYVWTCAAEYSTSITQCTGVASIWGNKKVNGYYFQWRRLDCKTR